ncbi:MAG: hypothetical protein ABR879_08825 [Methanomassiliicoccales archaeon]|jgi:hypothetical protein
MAGDERAVAGFQETLVAAIVITVASTILLASVGKAITLDMSQNAAARRSNEADRLLSSIRSCSAFEDDVLDLSRAGTINNTTGRESGTFSGVRVTLVLVLDEGSEIELGKRGTVPPSVVEIESRSVPVSVRTSPSDVTVGILMVSVWW